jgi:4-diphosphocytidyl-2-C-methyl-D-erythritol kinase
MTSRTGASASAVTARAHAKINLDLRVLGSRVDGFHELRTVFQAVALHDTVTCTPAEGPFAITCDSAGVPLDRTNLVWKAADALWRALRRTGPVRDVTVHLEKRIPLQAGLGGGSADAAATLVALARLWQVPVRSSQLTDVAAPLGADVPFFLSGGTALGLGRGDEVYPLADLPRHWVVLLIPGFGVDRT